MPLTLILMRHAKSSWGNPALDDFERPLNGRGRRNAPLIGEWLTDQGFEPAIALCSSAVRARQTLDGLGLETPASFLQELYMASPAMLLGAIRAAPSESLLVIAHNPGIAMLAADLTENPPDHPRFHDYPTAATLVLSFGIGAWSEIQPLTGRVLGFVTPHDLS